MKTTQFDVIVVASFVHAPAITLALLSTYVIGPAQTPQSWSLVGSSTLQMPDRSWLTVLDSNNVVVKHLGLEVVLEQAAEFNYLRQLILPGWQFHLTTFMLPGPPTPAYLKSDDA